MRFKATAKRVIYGCMAAAGLFASQPNTAAAEAYPTRPIEVVVPFPPGGTSDLSVRFLADKWAEFLGQPVIVVNKPGAGSALGAKLVASAKPDGYTLMLGSESPLLVVRQLQKNIDYDLNSFTFLHAYGKGAVFFAVKEGSRWNSLSEFIAEAKKRPKELTYATHGVGTLSHFIAEVLWKEANVQVTHVPFKSSPEGNAALLGGHVDLGVPPSLGGLKKSGGIKVLANSADIRVPYAPEIPSLKELGYNTSLTYYSILIGPKGLPNDVQSKLVDAHKKAYVKYKTEIDEGLNRLELMSVQLTGAEALKAMQVREAWLNDIAPSLGIQK